MKAYRYENYGNVEQLNIAEFAIPEIKPNEVIFMFVPELKMMSTPILSKKYRILGHKPNKRNVARLGRKGYSKSI